ncbi:MAG TPA: hypothetical protein VE127_17650, partial [Solirubrobacteraceae bacterium]|nr:hypothetical protein [Solirubrobacteraceae bacterium]
YMHRTRRIYDIHLADFMREWLGGCGQFPVVPGEHVKLTDNEVLAAIVSAAHEPDTRLGVLAGRIVERDKRFGLLYELTPAHRSLNADAARRIAEAARDRYEPDAVRLDSYDPKQDPFDFPVQTRSREIASSTQLSDVLARVPTTRFQRVYLDCQDLEDAKRWLEGQMESLIAPREEPEGDYQIER